MSQEEQIELKKGEMNPPIPVPYRYSGGRTVPADFISVGIDNFLVSERIRDLFISCNFTGWKTYPICLYDKSDNRINGYYGFVVTGEVGPMDISRSKLGTKPSMFGEQNIVKLGIYFDESSWNGSDFINRVATLVTSRVVDVLRKAKVKNWEAMPASEYEMPISYEVLDPNFLTEDERDKVNELRRDIAGKQHDNYKKTTEILAQEKISVDDEFLHLLKSIVQNGCIFETMSDQSFCRGILESLNETGQLGIKRMIEALLDKDREVRVGAAWALGKLKVREAVDPLLKAIKDEEDDVRKEAVMALGEIGDSRAVISLLEVLEEEDVVYVRCSAALALGAIGDQRAMQPLISILNNEEEVFILSDAASILGKFGNPQAVLPLINLFENEDSNLAEHIKCALMDIGQPAVIPLIQALGYNHPLVRGRAAWTLGQMGEKKAILSLIDSLAVEKDPEVLAFVVEALGQLGDRRAIKPILNIAKNVTIEYLQEEIGVALQKIQEKNK